MYSFNGAGGAPDQLPMKQKKGTKGVSNYRFTFLEKKTKPKFESRCSDKPQIAISGTKHTITISENRILHRKPMSKPISKIIQDTNNRGTGIYQIAQAAQISGNGQRFRRADADTTTARQHKDYWQGIHINGPNTEEERRVRTRTTKINPEQAKLWLTRRPPTQPDKNQDSTGPLTTTAENMTDREIDRIIEDGKKGNKELLIKDLNGKVDQFYTKIPTEGEEDSIIVS